MCCIGLCGLREWGSSFAVMHKRTAKAPSHAAMFWVEPPNPITKVASVHTIEVHGVSRDRFGPIVARLAQGCCGLLIKSGALSKEFCGGYSGFQPFTPRSSLRYLE